MSRLRILALPLVSWCWIVAPPHATEGVFSGLSAALSDWVRLRLFDGVSQWRATLRDYAPKRPESSLRPRMSFRSPRLTIGSWCETCVRSMSYVTNTTTWLPPACTIPKLKGSLLTTIWQKMTVRNVATFLIAFGVRTIAREIIFRWCTYIRHLL